MSAAEMLEAAGGQNVRTYNDPRWASHEVGCARMGTDPKTSVLTPFQQLHDVSNVCVMDASGFASSGWANPTLTIMALAVRSTDHLLERMRAGEIQGLGSGSVSRGRIGSARTQLARPQSSPTPIS